MTRRLTLVPLALLSLLGAAPSRTTERVAPNDNLASAGAMEGGILRLRLDTRLGMWHPDVDDAPGAEVPAFGEAGKPLQIPGPMIRVRAGTEVEADVALDQLADLLLQGHPAHQIGDESLGLGVDEARAVGRRPRLRMGDSLRPGRCERGRHHGGGHDANRGAQASGPMVHRPPAAG